MSKAIVLYRDPDKPDLQLLIETAQTHFKCITFISTVLRPLLQRAVFPEHVVRQKKINSQCGYGIRGMDAFI